MNAIYLDCFAGISGNMFLGACLQLGVPLAHLIAELDKLTFDDHYSIEVNDVSKNGIAAVHLDVELEHHHHHHDHDHHHDHEHHHHHHRSMSDIRSIIESSTLSLEVKKLALLIFEKLAAAEGKVHNKPPEEVHFHEVGAVDSIVDIVGCAICIDYLNIDRVFVSKINVGSGMVNCAHGLMPVSAPATAELLAGFPTYRSSVEKELTTPTGAAIVAALAEHSNDLPNDLVVEKIGYGAGTYELEIPTVLRIYLG
ncbi:MAG: nickel pincer cofactor biosynthesis protein LarC, partial [Selenomonadaceae bacterium]|nr:nickel pincer cofactor biosynthesis protein LarC [Selenomonadaceae bacterium]